MFEKVEEKSFFAPWRQDGWVLGVPPSIIVRNRAPCGAGLARKVLWDDNLAPFSSDKIRAKILDLGYGGARRALHNLSPKSARILSAAITRTPLPPAGVRIELPAGVRIGPPAGVRTPRDDFHSGVG